MLDKSDLWHALAGLFRYGGLGAGLFGTYRVGLQAWGWLKTAEWLPDPLPAWLPDVDTGYKGLDQIVTRVLTYGNDFWSVGAICILAGGLLAIPSSLFDEWERDAFDQKTKARRPK